MRIFVRSTTFNSRLQPEEIALGTAQNGYDKLKLNYAYGVVESGTLNTVKNNGNIQSQTITVAGTNGFTAVQSYTYDSLNRLKTADEKPQGWTDCTSDPTKCWSQEFSYDRFGNRNFVEAPTTTLPKNCGTSVCTADKKIVNPAINISNNRLSTGDGYLFDNAGNTTKDAQLRRFTYDGENKQVKVETVNAQDQVTGTVGEYWYDGDGRRVKKYVPYVDEEHPGEVTVLVYDAMGKLVAEYSTGVADNNTAQVAYLSNDHLGSPRINTDKNGNVTARHDYHPFGEEIASVQRTVGLGYTDDAIRKQFTGYERDSETGLDFAQARYFAANLGRFASPDPVLSSGRIPLPQSWNKYAYVLNSPTSLVDPDGFYECKGTEEQCKQFANRLQKVGDLLKNPNLSEKQKGEISRSLTSFGTPNDNNGLTVTFGKLSKNENGRTGFTKTTVNGDERLEWLKPVGGDKYVANITVTFAEGYDEDTITHEGSHIADRQDLVGSLKIRIEAGDDLSNEQIMADPKNIRKYYGEMRAYLVSAAVNKSMGVETRVWQKGWAEADSRTISGINNILKSESVYRLSPEGTKPGPGPQLLEWPKKN